MMLAYMMATLGGEDLHKDDCIFTLYISSSGMLSSYTTLHPHNVSSFSTLHLLRKKIRQKDLTYVPYLPTHFIIFTYSHVLTIFPPYTYHRTLCVTFSVIGSICVHVPMSLWARTSAPDECHRIKVVKSD